MFVRAFVMSSLRLLQYVQCKRTSLLHIIFNMVKMYFYPYVRCHKNAILLSCSYYARSLIEKTDKFRCERLLTNVGRMLLWIFKVH